MIRSTNLPFRRIARLVPLFLCLLSLVAYGQKKKTPADSSAGRPTPSETSATVETSNSLFSPRIIPASPNVASLGKYVDVPVNNYTGTPDVSIPLYTIKTRDLAVPISISYHGSGVRVEDEASSVGLGWALNSGGVIRHVVRGTDDFQDFDAGTKWRYLNNATTTTAVSSKSAICYFFQTDTENAAWFFPNRTTGPNGGQVLDSKLQDMIAMTGNERPDIERDIFAFNFLGMSGKFMIEPLGSGQYKIHQLAQSDLSIKLNTNAQGVIDTTGTSGFIITGTDGTKYTFSQVEQQRSRTGPMMTAKTQNQNYDLNNLTSYYNTFVGAWYLTKIESQRGDIITFTYTTTDWINALPGRSESYVTSVGGGTSEENFRWSITDVWTKHVYPSTITFDNGSVQFTNASRTDLKTGAMRLASLSVTATGGTALKTVQFNQDYFSSGTSAPSFISKRLKLVAVQESNNGVCLPPHSFTYNESTLLPDKDSYMQDFWGYYNAQVGNETKGTLLPPFSINGSAASNIYKLPTSLQGGADRSVNSTAMRAGVLTNVSYPTEATAEFDFQPHVFANIASTNRPYFMALDYATGNIQQGGGLRINKITVKDQANVSKVTTYDYTSSGTPTGKLMYNLQFSDFSAYTPSQNPGSGATIEMVFSSSPRHPMGSGAQGNPIGYSQVTVYTGSTATDAGYSIYQYKNVIDTRDVNFCIADANGNLSDLTQCLTQPSSDVYNYYCDPYNIGQNNNHTGLTDASLPNYVYTLNGSLLHEEHWTAGTTPLLLKTVDNTYEAINRTRLKNFKAIKRSNIASCLIYYTDSEWIRPTTTIVNDYGAGGAANSTTKVTTTTVYGYNSAGLHKQTASVTTTNSKGEQFETLTAYAQDSISGSSWLADLKARNMVVQLRETRNKINTDQSRTTTHITRTNYAKWFNSFMAPKTIESKIGTGPYVQDMAFSYAQGDSYSSLGDVLSTTELSGIQTTYQYYTGSGKKYLALNSTVPAGSSLARTTTYDYEPLKGVSRITDPNNLQTTYSYDLLGRLVTIKDPDQYVLKTYHYNYATTGCNTTNTLISPNFKNVVIVGNSITQLIAQSGNDGWQSQALLNNINDDGSKGWGRAASVKANDFAHILESRFKQLNTSAKVLPLWEAKWEYDYSAGVPGWTYYTDETKQYNYTKLKAKITNYFGTQKPDLVIIRLGENINNGTVDQNFKGYYNTLIDQVLSVSNPGAKVILTNSMWANQPLANARIKEVATERNLPFVDLSDLIYNPVYLGGNDPSTLQQFPNDGGDTHPGDVGMLEIADRIWGKLFNETKQLTVTIPNCSSLAASVLTGVNNATVVGTDQPGGYVTTGIAVTTCAPIGTTINQVDIWATTPSGQFLTRIGTALPDPSRPGAYTLSATMNTTTPGYWNAGALYVGAYSFSAIVTTNLGSYTSAANAITISSTLASACSTLMASILSPANNTTVVGTDQPGGYVTTALAVTTCAPTGTTINQVDIWATIPSGQFLTRIGTALPDASRPGAYTMSASRGTAQGLWNAGALNAGTYSFSAIVTTNAGSYTSAASAITISSTITSACSNVTVRILSPVNNATVVGTDQPDGLVTTALAVTTCAPAGTTINQVDIWATTTSGQFLTRIGTALPDASRPGTYTLSATRNTTTPGYWNAGALYAGTYSFSAVVTTSTGSYTSVANAITISSTVTSTCSTVTASVFTPANSATVVGTMQTDGYLTTSLAVTTCSPAGTTINQVEIWASLLDGAYLTHVGTAYPTPLDPEPTHFLQAEERTRGFGIQGRWVQINISSLL